MIIVKYDKNKHELIYFEGLAKVVDLETLKEECEEQGIDLPKYVSYAWFEPVTLDIDNIISDATCECEDPDEIELQIEIPDSLHKAIEEFNKINKNIGEYYVHENILIDIEGA